MKTAALLTLLALTVTASARIGETAEELDARYGTPVRKTAGPTGEKRFEKRTYNSGGMEIACFVWMGRSHQEIFKVPNGELSKEQVEKILADHSFGGQWEKTSFEVEASSYTLAKRLNAVHDHVRGGLVINTAEFSQARENFERILRQEREEDQKKAKAK